MPAWAKVLLGIGCGFAVLTAGIGVAIFFYINSHKDAWLAGARKAKDEASAFAKGKTSTDCIDESLRRLRDCSGIACEVQVRVFLHGCLENATESPQLCDAVPAKSEIFRSAEWAIAECSRRGMRGSQPCSRVMQELQTYCDRRPHR